MEGEGTGDGAEREETPPATVMALPPETRSVARARRSAREVLSAWHAEDLEWAACQLVTELATNAVLHAGTEFEVSLAMRGHRLRCEVSDASPAGPRVRHHSPEATTGRGLQLVERLAVSWGVIPRPRGKTVWFELEPTPDGGAGYDEDEDLREGLEELDGGSTAAPTSDQGQHGHPAQGASGRTAHRLAWQAWGAA